MKVVLSRVAVVVATAVMAPAVGVATASAIRANLTPNGCRATTGAAAGDGAYNGVATKTCDDGTLSTPASGPTGEPAPVTRVVDCGPRRVAAQLRSGPSGVCGPVQYVCHVFAAMQLPTDPAITTTGTMQRSGDGSWTLVAVNCVATNAAPQVTALVVMQQVRKLVPHPKVGVAPPGGATLVNIQTLLWAETPADQSLGTVTLLGHQVALQVHVARVDWDFGDGQADTTNGPERRYDPAAGCRTVTCPGYWGHVYATTGAMTITATVTWSGRYRVDGGAWLDIPGTVTGPATTAALTVRQARGVLVPNPGEH